jgi:hypothetical protein
MEPSQVIWTRFPEKPAPLIVTEVPAGPSEGESDRDGAGTSDAKVDANGSISAPETMIIVAVAARSRQRVLRRSGGGVSETH